jgi:aspartyl/asparaginyl-tRNA synthetase
LVKNIQKFGLNPEDFKDYTDNFKYGMPPHGGWGLGLERIVEKILGLSSIKEAILFPRDVKRLTP